MDVFLISQQRHGSKLMIYGLYLLEVQISNCDVCKQVH